jgi:hypothetical protein
VAFAALVALGTVPVNLLPLTGLSHQRIQQFELQIVAGVGGIARVR